MQLASINIFFIAALVSVCNRKEEFYLLTPICQLWERYLFLRKRISFYALIQIGFLPKNCFKWWNNIHEDSFPSLHSESIASTCKASIFFPASTTTPLFFTTEIKASSYLLNSASSRYSAASPSVHWVLLLIMFTAASVKLLCLESSCLYLLVQQTEGTCYRIPEHFFLCLYSITSFPPLSFSNSWIKVLTW